MQKYSKYRTPVQKHKQHIDSDHFNVALLPWLFIVVFLCVTILCSRFVHQTYKRDTKKRGQYFEWLSMFLLYVISHLNNSVHLHHSLLNRSYWSELALSATLHTLQFVYDRAGTQKFVLSVTHIRYFMWILFIRRSRIVGCIFLHVILCEFHMHDYGDENSARISNTCQIKRIHTE